MATSATSRGRSRDTPFGPPVGDPSLREEIATWPTGRLLSTAARLVEGAWTARLAERGLTHAGLMALHELEAAGTLPVLELATRCQVAPQTMTRTLDRLERDGLVTRSRSERDRRRVEVVLTATGSAAYAEAADMSEAEPALLGDVLDLDALRRNLVAIIEHVTSLPVAPSGRTLPQ